MHKKSYLIFFFVIVFASVDSLYGQTTAERLGYKATDKLLIINNDDAGMCHSANMATIEGMEKGNITSATIMTPCSWSIDMMQYAKNHPEKGFGVHLTHTCEWKRYRWGPVAAKNEVKGLVDPSGCLWPGVKEVYLNAKAEEAYIEGKAQIQRALDAGVPVTHIDSHMGTMQMNPLFLEKYFRLAKEFDLPLRMPSQKTCEKYGFPKMRDVAAKMGLVFTDEMVYEELQDYGKTDIGEFWKKIIRDLKPGITELYIHATVLTEESKAITGTAVRRSLEFELFTHNEEMKKLLKEEGIILISYRPLLELQRREK